MTARYPQLLRALGEPGWWRPVVGLLFAAVSLTAGAVGVILAAVVVAAVLGGSTGDDAMEEALSPDGPLGLLANNLVIAVMIPAAALAVYVVHRAPIGALASVTAAATLGAARPLLPGGAAARRRLVRGQLRPAGRGDRRASTSRRQGRWWACSP